MHTHRDFPERDIEQSIAARFERQVQEFPHNIAVQAPDQVLTYTQLNNASNRVAQAVLALRGDREEPIGLLVEQGLSAVVMLLGVLKAGKFYVPLDTNHPVARLSGAVRDVQPAIVLTNATHHRLATEIAQKPCQVVNCEELDSDISEHNPNLKLSADRTGYLFYTSGSTGKPKGVTQPQRNILHQVMTYTNGLQISAADRLTLLHSHAFSASRLDIFGALLNGAAVLPFSVADAGISNLIRWLEHEEITLSHWVPTLFRHVADSLEEDQQFPAMRAVVLGSEPVLPRDVALYKKHFATSCILVNRFGTTETGNIRWLFLNNQTEIPSQNVPVGYPVTGAEVFLTDEHGAKARTGQIGEISVRSRYLSPGYWNNPELTRAVFLPDPQGGDKRVYRTGDLGRLRPDGCLEHLGRTDSQVKIRGFRIEKQEVEALLSQHPSIRESVVEVAQDEHGDNRLIGYVVPVERGAVQIDGIRDYLAATLPHYMLPSVFVVVDALPRTPNGKVDRLALPAVSHDVASSIVGSSLSADATEARLIAIWSAILGVAVAVTDNFFDLGGNSLLAAYLMVRIQQSFGRQLLPAVIFRAPTVAQFAEILRREDDEVSLPSLVPIQPNGSSAPFFWIHGDSSNAVLPHYLGADQPLYGLEHQSQDGKAAVYTRVETIAEHYLRQIRQIQAQGPYLLGGYSFGGTVAFEIAQQLKKQRQTVALLVMLDSIFPGVQSSSSEIHESGGISTSPSAPLGNTLSHLQELRRLGPRDQIKYLVVRLQNKADTAVGRRLRRVFKKLLCNVCLKTGRALPADVRSFYILEIYKHALGNYSPRVFAGRAVYVKSTARSNYHQESWTNLMKDGLEVHEVSGDHMTVVKKENVAAWAGQLKSWIARAQAS